jgi:phenylpropionate dioxygenase-like ring-hydroxylating dioxygenase large terminal subunit
MRNPPFGAFAGDLHSSAPEKSARADDHGAAAIVFSEHHGADECHLPTPQLPAAAIAARSTDVRVNVEIPYQEKPNKSKRLRAWPVVEQYGSVFVSNDPDRRPPTWALPDIFKSFPQFETDPGAYYEPIVMKAGPEPVHPQFVAENGPDSVHFQYVHRATVTPVALDWRPDGPIWKFVTGWPDARSDDPHAMALRIHSWLFGLGGAISAFEGQTRHRLTFTVTPIEEERPIFVTPSGGPAKTATRQPPHRPRSKPG